jgi:CRP-like cAMP-binding protein
MGNEDKLVFQSGSILFAEGEKSHFLYLIKRGKVLLVKENNKSLKKVDTLGPQEIIGLTSLVKDCLHENTAFSIGQVEVIKIKKTEIKAVLSKCAPWVFNLIKTISERLEKTNKLMTEHNILEEEKFLDNDSLELNEADFFFLLSDYREKMEE